MTLFCLFFPPSLLHSHSPTLRNLLLFIDFSLCSEQVFRTGRCAPSFELNLLHTYLPTISANNDKTIFLTFSSTFSLHTFVFGLKLSNIQEPVRIIGSDDLIMNAHEGKKLLNRCRCDYKTIPNEF